MTDIRHGTTSKVGVPQTFALVTDQKVLTALWYQPFNLPSEGWSPSVPKIDFDQEMVAAAVLATSGDGCASVTMTRAQALPDRVLVHYKRFKRSAHGVCTDAFTTAFHFVKLPRVNLPVSFAEEEEPVD